MPGVPCRLITDLPHLTPQIERAVADDARPEALVVIERLPDDRYSDLRELWKYLDDVPVEIV